jgi:glutamate/tyrosine decarboxylase-like PLP-dependent enzyme
MLTVHHANLSCMQVWEKLTNYMEIEPRWVANRPGNYMASTEDLVAACDENTIGKASGRL